MKLIDEKSVYYLWENIKDMQTELYDDEGNSITVINSGKRNYFEGPDYYNAVIQKNNKKYKGKIEIHRMCSDWYIHNHHTDEKYNNVILHVSYYPQNDIKIRRADDRFVPNITLNRFLENIYTPKIISYLKKQNWKVKHQCYDIYKKVDKIYITDFIQKLGLKKINNNLDKINFEIKCSDYENMFYKFVLRTAGYFRNKQNFINLFNEIDLYKFREINDIEKLDTNKIKAILLGMSGFFIKKFKHKYYKYIHYWNDLKWKYNLNTGIDFNQWNFFRVRPNNNPVIRIMNLSDLIFTLINNEKFVYNMFNKNNIISLQDFIKLMNKNLKLFGFERVKKACVNYLYPLYLLFLKNEKNIVVYDDFIAENYKSIFFYYNDYVEKTFLKQIFGLNSNYIKKFNALEHLGVHYLFNNYCKKNKCKNCELSKVNILTVC